jgi:hypothetical protein
MTTAPVPRRHATRITDRAPERAPGSPTWVVAVILASAAGIVTGLMWDISWHMSIGRDTFWAAPHMLEYISGVTAGVVSGWVVLRTTFGGTPEQRAASVTFWGFKGPLGAWITIWGTFAMLLSAPFDDWWHNAYGLDVKIVSPPHMVLFWGMLGIVVGAVIIAVAAQNRSAGQPQERRDAWFYAVAGGVMCFIFGAGTLEYSWPNSQHWPMFYRVWALVFPALLVGYSCAGRLKYPATAAALVFMAIWFLMAQVLRQFDATPRLAPIWNPRTYFWPPYFPTLLVVPAFGIDLVRHRLAARKPWLQSLAIGATFVLLLFAVQYPFSTFMVKGPSQNWFFNANEWPYFSRSGPWQRSFWVDGEGGVFGSAPAARMALGLLWASLIGALSARLGLLWGGWMARVKR